MLSTFLAARRCSKTHSRCSLIPANIASLERVHNLAVMARILLTKWDPRRLLALNFCRGLACGSSFVQSGFYEVALMTLQRARSLTRPRPHRTLKISRIDRGMIQDGKLRGLPWANSGADGLHRRRGSQFCPASERCCAGATAVSDCGRARRRLAQRGGHDRWHGSSDAAGLGNPVQRGGADGPSISLLRECRPSSTPGTRPFSPESSRRVRSLRSVAWCAGGRISSCGCMRSSDSRCRTIRSIAPSRSWASRI
jgi:hypothetical protein